MKPGKWLALAVSFLPLASAAVSPSVQTIIAKSVVVNDTDWKSRPAFDFTERDVTKTGTKTYRVQMILGSPYYRLIAVNGEPLPPDAEQDQQRRRAKTITQRQAESPEQRAGRIARYQKGRQRNHLLLSQLTVAFDFTLQQDQRIGPYDVYVLKATRRAGYRPPNLECQALTGMEGTLWIDKASFQWVKVEAHVVQPVSIAGFLARVQLGTHFELEQAPVTSALWLPTHFAMRALAKVLGVWNHASQDDETYSNYQKPAQPYGATSLDLAHSTR